MFAFRRPLPQIVQTFWMGPKHGFLGCTYRLHGWYIVRDLQNRNPHFRHLVADEATTHRSIVYVRHHRSVATLQAISPALLHESKCANIEEDVTHNLSFPSWFSFRKNILCSQKTGLFEKIPGYISTLQLYRGLQIWYKKSHYSQRKVECFYLPKILIR